MTALQSAARQLGHAQQTAGTDGELDSAVEVSRAIYDRAVLGSEVHTSAAVIFAGALSERFRRSGRPSDLDDVVSIGQRLLPMASSNPSGAPLENYLGSALLARFLNDRRPRELDTAIHWFRSCLAHAGSVDALANAARNNLAIALGERHQLTGDPADLREAQELTSTFATHSAGGDLGERIAVACTEASSLAARWRVHADPDDLRRAVDLLETVLDEATADPAVEHPMLGQLLLNLADRLDDIARARLDDDAADDAIGLYRAALERLPPDTAIWAAALTNCAAALASRFEINADPDDVDEALEYQQLAAGLMTAPRLAGILANNTGWFRQLRYRTSDDPLDLAEAERELDRSLAALRDDTRIGELSDAEVTVMRNRAICAYLHHTRVGDRSELDRAVDGLRAIVDGTRSAVHRLDAAANLAEIGVLESSWPIAVAAAEVALSAIESVSGAVESSRWREWLRRGQGVAALGAYAAARLEQLPLAIELLERGCAVLAAARIAQQHVALSSARAAGFGRLVDDYVAAADDVRTRLAAQASEPIATINEAIDADSGAGELTNAIEGLTYARQALAEAAGPVAPAATVAELAGLVKDGRDELAYLISTPVGGLRLTVHEMADSDGRPPLQADWLPLLREDAVEDWVARLHYVPDDDLAAESAADDRTVEVVHEARPASVRGRFAGPAPSEVAAVLTELAAALTDQSNATPGLRLVPVGLLALLPMAAAWPSATAEHGGAARAISVAGSGFLHLTARRNAARSREPGPMRIAALTDPRPCTWQGLRFPALPFAVEEGLMLEQDYDAQHVTGRRATADALTALLCDEALDAVHIAAHGDTDSDDPDRVALLLADPAGSGRAETWTIERLPSRLRCRSLFLACCWLARTDSRLPDEAVGFPTSLLQAGAASVIAPLWPVDDRAAGEFVTLFYEHRLLNGRSSAESLAAARTELGRRVEGDPRISPDQRGRWRATAAAFLLTGE